MEMEPANVKCPKCKEGLYLFFQKGSNVQEEVNVDAINGLSQQMGDLVRKMSQMANHVNKITDKLEDVDARLLEVEDIVRPQQPQQPQQLPPRPPQSSQPPHP